MREILFRAFHECENGEQKVFINGEWRKGVWVEGMPFSEEGSNYIIICLTFEKYPNRSEYMSYCSIVEVLPETVGQYTGLTDKNGAKIFEGDILVTPSSYIGTVMDIVEYKNASFVRNNGRRKNPYLENGSASRIIGNIHDNPELLEGVQNG